MPPSQKKRNSKPSPHGPTLHNFFGAAPQLSKTPTLKSRQSTRLRLESEIIVIDSDSDDSIEFIENPVSKKPRLSSNTKSVDVCPATNEQTVVASGSGLTKISFGAPFLLVDSKPKPDEQPEKLTEEIPTFGAPFLLRTDSQASGSQPDYDHSQHNSMSDTAKRIQRESKEKEVDIDLTCENWENGDDENAPEYTIYSDDDDNLFLPEQVVDDDVLNERIDASHSDIHEKEECNPFAMGDTGSTSTSRADSKEKWHAPLPGVFKKTEFISCDGKRGPTGNAFSVLMTSLKENEIWKEAEIADRKSVKKQSSKNDRRKAPFYKVLQGMPIAVDAFKYGAIPNVTAYFLTHAHSDHYTNLSSSWKHGPIYCSEGTANLIIHMLSVDKKWVHPLPLNTPTQIPNTNGVTVTLIEANHCPGSCLFFFEGRQTVNAGDSTYKSPSIGSQKIFRYLHCGDFRASPRHVLHPAVKGKVIDHVYLDTTYLDPKYTFPPQPLVISACADLAKRLIENRSTSAKNSTISSWVSSESKGKGKEQPSRPLFVVGTYSIGKERIVKAIANALSSKIFCDKRKAAILKCQGDAELDALLTNNPRDAMVHLVPLATINLDDLKHYLDRFHGFYSKVIGFRPTGWTFVPAAGKNSLPSVTSVLTQASSKRDYKYSDLKVSAKSTSTTQVYPVPYSEHSSFYELTCFAMSFDWTKMIATVNVGSESSRNKMKQWVDKWEAERRKQGRDFVVPYRSPDYW